MNHLEAIILAGGRGQNLYPLTKENNKHMLPICGKPLLAYSLEKCLDNHFKHITIVVNQSNEARIRHFVHSRFKHPKLKQAHVACYVADSTHCLTEVLAEMITKYIIKRDFLMIYGDAISSYCLSELIDNHYINRSDVTCGFLDTRVKVSELQKAKIKQITNNTSQLLAIFVDEAEEQRNKRGQAEGNDSGKANQKKKKKHMIKAAELAPKQTACRQSARMMKVISREKLEKKGALNFKANLVDKSRQLQIRQDLSLANVYLISRQMFPILVHLSPKFSSFSEEMIGFLIDYQQNTKLLSYLGEPGAQKIVRERRSKPKNTSITPSLNGPSQDSTDNHQADSSKPNVPDTLKRHTFPIIRLASMHPAEDISNQDPANSAKPQSGLLRPKKKTMSSIFREVSNVFYTVNRIEDHEENSGADYRSIWDEHGRENRLRIGMHIFKDFYKRVNSLEDFRTLNLEALKLERILPEFQSNKNSMSNVTFSPEDHKLMGLRNCVVSPQAHLKKEKPSKINNSIICEQVKIGNGCLVENCVLLKNVKIGEGCKLRNVCIGQDSIVRDNCKLTNAFFGEKNLVKEGLQLDNDTFNMTYNPNEMLLHVDVIEDTPRSRKHSAQIGSP